MLTISEKESTDKPDEQFKKWFHTSIAVIISDQQLPNEATMRAPRLQTEDAASQHQCCLVTYYDNPMEEEKDIRPSIWLR